MELKLYKWNESEEIYDYCGGYLTFKSYEDLSKYIYILMSDLFYDNFIIDLIYDLRDYDVDDLKSLKNNATLCMFRTRYLNSFSNYKICVSND